MRPAVGTAMSAGQRIRSTVDRLETRRVGGSDAIPDKCSATEGGRSWAVRAGPQGIERLVNSRAALLAGELIEHGVDPLLRRYIRSFLRWGCRHAGRRQLVGAKKSIADQQQ